MAQKLLELPKSWGVSEQQESVICFLGQYPGQYVTAAEFCNELYPDDDRYKDDAPAPTKLRVLIQRCRQILSDQTEGEVSIYSRRGQGWMITRRHGITLLKIVAED